MRWFRDRSGRPERITTGFSGVEDLPHSLIPFHDDRGRPLRLLVTRNVYGDQVTSLVDVLVRDKGIRRIVLYGNCGGLGPDLAVGDLLEPTAAALGDGAPERLPVRRLRPRLPWAADWTRGGSCFSVVSPVEETVAMVERVRRSGFAVVDAEVGHLGPLLRRLARQGFPVDFSCLLQVSDVPGSGHTLEDLRDAGALLLPGKEKALDLILGDLGIAAP
jgi:hypothetical protein